MNWQSIRFVVLLLQILRYGVVVAHVEGVGYFLHLRFLWLSFVNRLVGQQATGILRLKLRNILVTRNVVLPLRGVLAKLRLRSI